MAVLEEIEGGVSPEELARSSSSNVAETSSKFFRQRSGPTAGKDLDEDLTSEWNLEDSDVDDDDNVLAEHVAFVEEPNAAELYADLQESKLSERAEWTFDFVLWCIPFAFLFELLNLLAQKQYHQESSFAGEIATLAKRLPPLFLFIGWSLREQRRWLTQAVTFVVGTLAGCYLAYVVNKASYDIALARTPALGTLWILAIVRLDLSYALASVGLFGAYVYVAGLKLVL